MGIWRIIIGLYSTETSGQSLCHSLFRFLTGTVTRREGINCEGTHWVDKCPTSSGALGPISNYHIQDTSPMPLWWIRFNTDEAGNITEMWGKDTEGNHWIAIMSADGDDELK